MRTPLLSKTSNRTAIAKTKNYPAPIGGWNSRDSYAKMAPTDAVILDNIYPDNSYCYWRYGSENFATGTTNNIKTLGVFTSLSGSQTVFGATSTGIYNVSSSGAVGASVLARTNGKHQIVNMGDGTNNWLMMFNGVDKPAYYNGTTWTAVDNLSVPALTGVTSTGLITGMVFKGRLILGEINTMKFWYLASGAVGGALTAFDLTTYASRGGYLVAMGNWTYDGGSGQDDRAVFVTSEGEVIVYEGTDPGVAANWARVGTYYFGKPLGRRCLCKYGGDLLVLTQNGIIELSKALTGVVNESQFKLSDKIRKSYTESAISYGSVFGWEATIYPKENSLVVNIPNSEDGVHYQYVMNLTTKAWCRFTDWPAETFTIYNDQLYFAVSTKTVRAWARDRVADYTNTGISSLCAPAFTDFGVAEKKHILGVAITANSPVGSSNGQMEAFSDFSTIAVTGGVSNYTFPNNPVLSHNWYSPAYPMSMSASFSLNSGYPGTQWIATDWLYEIGSVL